MAGMTPTRSYDILVGLRTLRERFEYLKLDASTFEATFGSRRYLNQGFYHSTEWRHIRDEVIVRDNGCELGCDDYPIGGRIIIHHINPILPDQLKHFDDAILDPNNLICCSHRVHNAIHYGDASMLPSDHIERRKGDTAPWLRKF